METNIFTSETYLNIIQKLDEQREKIDFADKVEEQIGINKATEALGLK